MSPETILAIIFKIISWMASPKKIIEGLNRIKVEIVALILLGVFIYYLLIYYNEIFYPLLLVVFLSVFISIMISLKYIRRQKYLFKSIDYNNLWKPWQLENNYKIISNNQLVFSDSSRNPNFNNGVLYYDLNHYLDVGDRYEISCNAKSSLDSTCKFKLLCHDSTDNEKRISEESTSLITPSSKGEIFKVIFKAIIKENIRIELHYQSGKGNIEISNIKIFKIFK